MLVMSGMSGAHQYCWDIPGRLIERGVGDIFFRNIAICLRRSQIGDGGDLVEKVNVSKNLICIVFKQISLCMTFIIKIYLFYYW